MVWTKGCRMDSLDPNHPPETNFVTLLCAADVTPESIQWLWDGWLAKGKLHIIAGIAGTGKTTIAIDLAARISSGHQLPDGSPSSKGSVLIWSGEDGIADTLRPRLEAANADLKKVHFVKDVTDWGEPRSFDPSTDMQELMKVASAIPDLALLIIDPIVNAVAGDGNKNGEVRRALQPVVDFAATLNCAVLGITHLNKGTIGKSALERVNGSIAFGALPRVVIITGKNISDGKTTQYICRAKSNIGLNTGGFEYEIQQAEVTGKIISSHIVWGESFNESADELLVEDGNQQSNGALENAKQFLIQLLSGGAVAQKQIKEEAEGAGYAWRTIQRAQQALDIKSLKRGAAWYWEMPNNQKHHQDRQDCQIK
jgi:putative DNA primase/helicase